MAWHYPNPPTVRIISDTETAERFGFTANNGGGKEATGLEVGYTCFLSGGDIKTAEAAFGKSVFVQVKRKNDWLIGLIGNTDILNAWSSIAYQRAKARIARAARLGCNGRRDLS